MRPELPAVRSLGHGVSVIPLPLPFRSPAWVNAYVIEGVESTVLLDCGVDWEPGRTALQAGLTDCGYSFEMIDRLVVTHLHPDHVGMAPRLVDEHDLELVMHRRAASLYRRYNDTEGLAERTLVFGRRHGVPDDLLGAFADIGPRPDFMPLLGPPDVVVSDGDHLDLGAGRRLEVLHTPGHDQSHICLRDSETGVLFSGDHVLPRITPVIMFDEQADDVLGAYLDGLRRLVRLRIGLTYPAHGMLVEHGTERCRQIILHHGRRLSGMQSIVQEAAVTAWSVMTRSYRPHLSVLDQRLALRETVAHLEHLRLLARISADDAGHAVRYRR